MTSPQRSSGSNRTALRAVLFFIILGTLPFYVLGIVAWAAAPAPGGNLRGSATPSDANATWTPLGANITATITPVPSATRDATATPLGQLQPTPFQFNPPPIVPTIAPTLFIPPQDTLAPTLTPFPTITPFPTNPPQPTSTPFPTNTPLPSATHTPVPLDSDGDGIPDDQDSCPFEWGTPLLNGCPEIIDSDNDGIPDDQDACPNEPGPQSNGGCPVDDVNNVDSGEGESP